MIYLPFFFLSYADSTKSAIVCIGAREMWKFCQTFFADVELATFMENCGLGDLIVATIGGRNRRVAEAFVTMGKVRRPVFSLSEWSISIRALSTEMNEAHGTKMSVWARTPFSVCFAAQAANYFCTKLPI